MKFKTSEIQKIQSFAKNKAQLTLKVNLIAGLLFSINPSYSAQAKKTDGNKTNDKLAIQTINEDYHSFLLNSASLVEVAEITSFEDTQLASEQTDVKALHEKLLEVLPPADYPDIVEQLEEKELTIGEFKEILNTLMEELAQIEANGVEDTNSSVQPEEETDLDNLADEEAADITTDSTAREEPEDLKQPTEELCF